MDILASTRAAADCPGRELIVRFRTSEVRELVEHAERATAWRMPVGRFKPQPCLILAADDGLYLVSNGLTAPGGRRVAYSLDFRPGSLYAGGSVEAIPTAAVRTLLKGRYVEIVLTPDCVELREGGRKVHRDLSADVRRGERRPDAAAVERGEPGRVAEPGRTGPSSRGALT